MLNHSEILINTKLSQNKHQSLQLNRLVKFIQNKKSPSFNKLKHILLKKENLLTHRSIRGEGIERQMNQHQNSQRQTVAINTQNIFVAKNKTETTSPSTHEQSEKKLYKIFVTKQTIKSLYQGKNQDLYPYRLKEKLNELSRVQQKKQSNLFPPLIFPKTKKPVMFEKYSDEASRWLNTDIKKFNDINQNQEQIKNKFQQKQQKNLNKVNIQNLEIQRQKYNKSLQKLIEKALRNKTKQKSLNSNFTSLIEGIEGFDSKLIVHGAPYEQDQNHEVSSYALKGKLLTNPNLKLKRNARTKSEKKACIQKPITLRNPEKNQKQQESKNNEEIQSRKKIIHTNRQAYYLESSLKLRTEISVNSAEYQLSSIRNECKTLKLIKEMESSMIKSDEKIKQRIRIFSQNKIENEADNEVLNRIILSTPKNQKRSKRKRVEIKQKTKTMQAEQNTLISKKTVAKWEIAGYDCMQSPEDLHSNYELQNYVQKMTKIPTIMTINKRMNIN